MKHTLGITDLNEWLEREINFASNIQVKGIEKIYRFTKEQKNLCIYERVKLYGILEKITLLEGIWCNWERGEKSFCKDKRIIIIDIWASIVIVIKMRQITSSSWKWPAFDWSREFWCEQNLVFDENSKRTLFLRSKSLHISLLQITIKVWLLRNVAIAVSKVQFVLVL